MATTPKLSDVKVGDNLVADGGFDCLSNREICEVCSDADSLYVPCGMGKHYLNGQLNEAGELVGFSVP